MKLSKLQNQLNQNSEYRQAEQKYHLQFELANAILKARIEKGWSQSELARRVGTKQANISRIENGLSNPTLNFLMKLTQVLDLKLVLSFEGMEITQQFYIVADSDQLKTYKMVRNSISYSENVIEYLESAKKLASKKPLLYHLMDSPFITFNTSSIELEQVIK
jgi:transcriptional regulator with XRE-family HTH domain